jgi:rfaE bifunctional protein kinase chain/domain
VGGETSNALVAHPAFLLKFLKGEYMKKKIEHIKILVVGDIMLDKYVVGNVSRISPEAPVQIVHVKEEYYTLGGCGNVVRNIRELGAQVDCLASVHMDYNGERIKDELDRIGVGDIVGYNSRETTVKERIIADERKVQMLRIDREHINKIDADKTIKQFKEYGRKKYDMIVISDYAKGMITKELMDFLRTQKTEFIVDPKPINGFLYNGAFMITPNEKEWIVMKLSSQYNLKNVKYILETKGSKGMCLYDFNQSWNIVTEDPLDIYNVSGCGDVVISVMAVCLSMGSNAVQAAKIANKCAGYTATKPGTSIITKERFNFFIDESTQL